MTDTEQYTKGLGKEAYHFINEGTKAYLEQKREFINDIIYFDKYEYVVLSNKGLKRLKADLDKIDEDITIIENKIQLED